ncbi:MAG: nitroreductase family protein [Rhodoglobus sp.]|nr:nitroreductase family protein [Rhodoglobus sp.]
MSALDAVRRRQSYPQVTDVAPSHEQLVELVEAAASIADHAALRPWRLIELRGDARARLGDAFVVESELHGPDAQKLAEKPLRAPLLIAVVGRHLPSIKVPAWEQEAVASGIAHTLSLLLHEQGWGVMWRTGGHTRSDAVRRVHELADSEHLMGWLYVGGIPESAQSESRRQAIDGERFLTAL